MRRAWQSARRLCLTVTMTARMSMHRRRQILADFLLCERSEKAFPRSACSGKIFDLCNLCACGCGPEQPACFGRRIDRNLPPNHSFDSAGHHPDSACSAPRRGIVSGSGTKNFQFIGGCNLRIRQIPVRAIIVKHNQIFVARSGQKYDRQARSNIFSEYGFLVLCQSIIRRSIAGIYV